MNELYEELIEFVLDRDRRNNINRIPAVISQSRNSILGSVNYAIVGGNSIWVPKGKKKFIDISVPDLVPATELARAYLEMMGMKNRGFKPNVYNWITTKAAPQYFQPQLPLKGTFDYVDIVSCYWQLYHTAQWDMVMGKNKHLGVISRKGSIEFHRCEEWRENKLARNSIWGLMISEQITFWQNNKLQSRDLKGDFYSAGIANWIQYQLHGMAKDLLETFPFVPMWNQDGFLVPEGKSQEIIEWLADRWQVEALVKEVGTGTIYAPGNYSWRKSGRVQTPTPINSLITLSPKDIDLIRNTRLSFTKEHHCG